MRRKVSALIRLSGNSILTDPKYRPALQTAARLTLLVDRAYETLKSRASLLDDDGELVSSLDVFRRLADSQLAALKAVGLMPTSVLPDSAGAGSLDAVFERIGRAKKARSEEPRGTAEASAD